MPETPLGYVIRRASTADVATVARQRTAMFVEMGQARGVEEAEQRFTEWLAVRLDATYFHWVAEGDGAVVAGAGVLLLDWPPSPRDPRGAMGFVYNVYTEPAHRRRGVARALLDTLHRWSAERGLGAIGLHASAAGRPLYEALGYRPTNEMRLDLRGAPTGP